MNSIQIFTERQIELLQKFVENPTPTTLAASQSFIEEQPDEIRKSQETTGRVSIPMFPEHQKIISYMEKFAVLRHDQQIRIDQCNRIIQEVGPSCVSFREFLFRCKEFAYVEEYECAYQSFPVGHIGISLNKVHINIPHYIASKYFYDSVVDRFHLLNEIEQKYAFGNTLQLASKTNENTCAY